MPPRPETYFQASSKASLAGHGLVVARRRTRLRSSAIALRLAFSAS